MLVKTENQQPSWPWVRPGSLALRVLHALLHTQSLTDVSEVVFTSAELRCGPTIKIRLCSHTSICRSYGCYGGPIELSIV